MADSLFDMPGDTPPGDALPAAASPLAVRMRPANLDDVVGQQHLLKPGSPLRRLVEGSGAASVILYGPPGTGKTTLASLISGATGRRFEALSALSAGVKEVRAVIEEARRAAIRGQQTVLFIDEVHRFSKTQQDALLAAVENRVVLLVAATTENPSFSVVAPLLSRSLILQLQPLGPDEVRTVLVRAATDVRGLGGKVPIAEDALDLLVKLSAGDARRALTALEVAAETAGGAGGTVTVEVVEQSLDQAAVRYDRDGDQH
ncbi:AAA family ATPase, partial [Mycolicibacterium diernhoferi]